MSLQCDYVWATVCCNKMEQSGKYDLTFLYFYVRYINKVEISATFVWSKAFGFVNYKL